MDSDEKAIASKRPFWTGRLTIGLVNIPVKLYTMISDREFSFRLLHKQDGQPLKYERVCTRDQKVIDWKDVVRGYEVRKNEFVVFTEEELKAARPQSDERIRLDKFVYYLSVDPIYFERSYILAPDKSEEAYTLMLKTLQKAGKAGVGRLTLRSKEYPVLVHEYKGALVVTTLRYAYEVLDPQDIEDLKSLKEPSNQELLMAEKIVGELTGEFDINMYRDGYSEKIEELVAKKLKGETIVAEKPQKEEVKQLMVALQETLKQLEKK